MKRIIIPIICALSFASCQSEQQTQAVAPITFSRSASQFNLVDRNKTISVLIDTADYAGIVDVAKWFATDLNKIAQNEVAAVTNQKNNSANQLVIVGTLGKNALIDSLVAVGCIDVKDVAGQWEAAVLQVIDNPFNKSQKALAIVGADKRGTMYGMLELSRRAGVSPWYYWADVPVQTHKFVGISDARYVVESPKVKYRGIFLNDEEPCLGRWAVNNFGGFTHEFYQTVFELLLRQHANFMWPAMWWAAFNSDDSANAELADRLGIVMSTSHHEPMNRAHAEWRARKDHGDWNYNTNAQELRDFWTEGIRTMGNRETVVTLAMRGDGDEAMEEGTNIALLERIVADQRAIIEKETGKPASETPQVWALYKEVQEYYDRGMKVPEDVILMLCDDNWGNIRRLPDPAKPKQPGGYGMYYHFDYVGGPRNYKWVNTNTIQHTWEQMRLCWQYGVDKIWLVNVGDLKPMELPISFFLDYAYNPDAIGTQELAQYTKRWVAEQFGNAFASEIADMITLYTRYNARCKPEMLKQYTYNLLNYREFETVTNDYKKLEERARILMMDLPYNQVDAYIQLVYHPIAACANMYDMYYHTALNQLYERQGRAATNSTAAKVADLFNRDKDFTHMYHSCANSKWNMMMSQTHISYVIWQQPDEDVAPRTKTIELEDKSAPFLAVEGRDSVYGDGCQVLLPTFDSYNKQTTFFEIFNQGSKPFNFSISNANKVLTFSKTSGNVIEQQRVDLSINWSSLAEGTSNLNFTINADKKTFNVTVIAKKFAEQQPCKFVENNGALGFDATDFTRKTGDKWYIIPECGRFGSSVSFDSVALENNNFTNSTPCLEYDFYVTSEPTDSSEITIYTDPTIDFLARDLHVAVSIDDQQPQVKSIHWNKAIDWGIERKGWSQSVSFNCYRTKSKHKIGAGKHTLKLWLTESAVVYEQIEIDLGGLKPTRLGLRQQ